MGLLEFLKSNSDKASENTENYIKATQSYIKLKVFEQLSISLSLIAKMLIIGGLFFIGLFFLAVSGAVALGNLLNNLALGCLIIGGVFVLFAVLVYYNREKINNKIIQKLSDKFFD